MKKLSYLRYQPCLPVAWALAAALLASAATAQVPQWKWRDTQGRMQYSDRPPPLGVPDKDILMRPAGKPAARESATSIDATATAPAGAPLTSAAASKPASRASATADPLITARRQQADAEAQAKRKADEDQQAVQRQDNCQRAREYQRVLQEGQRISRLNARGEREFLNDAQRAQEGERTRDVMASECRP